MNADTFWDDQADKLRHELVKNLLNTGSREDIVRLAGSWFAETSTNTQASVIAVLKARVDGENAAVCQCRDCKCERREAAVELSA